jgi:hypothetical protein
MKKRTSLSLVAAALALTAVSYFAYLRWVQPAASARDEILLLLPPDASVVIFADLGELRHAPFIAGLYTWAPKPQADPEYAQFLKETGFDYERDLDRIAVSIAKHGPDTALFAIAAGKFDRQKIAAYALKAGTLAKTAGHEIFSVPISSGQKNVSFTFLSNDLIALTDDSNLESFLPAKKRKEDAAEWRLRFERLAGSPIFVVIRQDAAAGSALAAQAPGGLRSPQLSALLDQLQWITVAGKPENDRLRIVAEGESAAEPAARQLTDMLNGVVILAQAGLNDPKTRQQLDPATREAYLKVLKSAEISKVDRGDTKSVRLILEITSQFLNVARAASPLVPGSTPNKPLPGKASASKKGHT